MMPDRPVSMLATESTARNVICEPKTVSMVTG